MTRDNGGQRSPLSPLRNHGAAAAADAVGSSTKDRGWQRRVGSLNRPSRLQPASEQKKSKKVEGSVLGPAAAFQPTPASRIPFGPRGVAPPSAAQQQQQQQPTPATGSSRIPRPPTFAAPAAGGFAGASPQHDLVAMLATPVAAPLLEEMHSEGNDRPASSPQQPEQEQSWESNRENAAEGPQGFHAYSNPSFDGVQFLADTPATALPAAAADTPAAGRSPRLFANSLAEAQAGSGDLTPGLLDPAALTPNSERSLEAWLRSSPATAATRGAPTGSASMLSNARGRSTAPPSTAGTAAGGSRVTASGKALPTPEAWQVLQHINDDSPPAAAPQGVRGIMNAYLRTGPQMLSPEPACAGVIRAPGAAAVPASGLLNVAGPGGAGVYGMMNAYLRTGANMLSPEPGAAGQQLPAGAAAAAVAAAAAQRQPTLHPYSPVSPLAVTPSAPRPAAAGVVPASGPARGSITPSSVCSNGNVSSSGSDMTASISLKGAPPPAAASVPRLNLGSLQQRQHDTDDTEISFGAALAGGAGSPGGGELPTARFIPAAASPASDSEPEEEEEAGEVVVGVTAQQRHGPPSPITFRLPASDSADQEVPPSRPAGDLSTFSFGMGAAPGSEEQQTAAPLAAPAAVTAGPDAAAAMAAAAAGMHHISSGETVQGPNPYNAMLLHLRGPQYASPARFMRGPTPDSPQSPRECTPLHLISTSDVITSPGAPTPAPGQGSLTVWMDRRGMRASLNTPTRNDLRMLWAAARDLVVYKSEAAALRADNVTLVEELEATQSALRELGVEHDAAVVAAEAGALCAEAEVARARDAAGHMMQLADQIQGMFALCEHEKEALVGELEAAQQQLAHSEAAAADAGNLEEQQAVLLQQQLEEARQAVAAAQQAADAAQQRARDAAAELESIRRQLAEAQQQLAAARAAPELTPVAKLRSQLGGMHDSLAHLHAEQCAGRLQAAHPELDQLLEASRGQLAHVEQLLGGDAPTLRQENDRLHRCLSQARSLLAENSPAPTDTSRSAGYGERPSPVLPFALFGRCSSEGEYGYADSPSACSDVFSSPYMAASQTTLTVDYRDLHSMQADTATSGRSSPAVSSGSPAAASPGSDHGSLGQAVWSPMGKAASGGGMSISADQQQEGEGEQEYTVVHNGMIITHVPASEVSKVKSMVQYWEAVASGSPPVVATEEEAAAAEAYASAAFAAAEAAMAARQAAEEEQAAAAGAAAEAAAAGEAAAIAVVAEAECLWQQEYSEAAAAADNAPLETAAEAEQEAAAAVADEAAAAEADQQPHYGDSDAEQPHAAAGEPQLQLAGPDGGLASTEAEGSSAALSSPEAALSPVGVPSPAAAPSPAAVPSPAASPSVAATPSRLTGRLPAGEAATPCSQPVAADVGTPARFTPLNFVAAPPCTPADSTAVDLQQAQQLRHLAVSMAAAVAAAGGASAAGTPASAHRTSSRLPATPAGTPVSRPVAMAVTPLALSTLRARMHGSGGGMQDAVRGRLARLKADLLAAQAKLATVDQGLASIAFTPTSSITNSGTPGSSASSFLRRTPLTGSTALGSPISGADDSPLYQQELSYGSSSSRAAALIAAAGSSPLAPAGASPAAVSQENRCENAAFSRAAQAPGLAGQEQDSSAPLPAAAAGCTPPVTRRSVRFAESVHAGSDRQGPLRMGTPYSAAAAAALAEAGADTASPVVASNRRSLLGFAASGASRAAGPQRSPLPAMQSAAKPAADVAPVRRFALEPSDDDSGSSDDDNGQLLFDASRMAQGANRHATPSPGQPAASPGGGTPMAHPEPIREADYGFDSYRHQAGAAGGGAGSSAAGTTPVSTTSVLSTSSFSPPEPLMLLAVRPMGRARRSGLLRGGRPRSETEEREFRRRAAALNIQISPYFRRRE